MRTAELLRNRRRKNKPTQKQELDNMVIFSMDVAALYPSVKKDIAAKMVRKAIETVDLEWENINTKSLVRHIAMRYERKIIKDLKLS